MSPLYVTRRIWKSDFECSSIQHSKETSPTNSLDVDDGFNSAAVLSIYRLLRSPTLPCRVSDASGVSLVPLTDCHTFASLERFFIRAQHPALKCHVTIEQEDFDRRQIVSGPASVF